MDWWYYNNHEQTKIRKYYEQVNVIDANVEKTNKLKQGVDLVFTSQSNKDDYDEDFNNLYGLVETSSDYSDVLQI